MGGSSGVSAPLVGSENNALSQIRAMSAANSNPQIASLLQSYGSGKSSLSDALGQISQLKGNKTADNASKRAGLQAQIDQLTKPGSGGILSDETYQSLPETQAKIGALQAQIKDLDAEGDDATVQKSAIQQLANDPLTGTLLATDQVKNGALTKGLFGDGGIQDQSQGLFGKLDKNLDEDRQALMGRDESYGLTNNDLKAYGQASGNIARMFGAQEQGLAQSLADRGLSTGGSGAAAVQFSGLQGNKAEQLGQLQQSIAQNRINTAKDLAQFRTQADANRQAQNNSLMQGLGQLGQGAVQAQYARNTGGSNLAFDQAMAASGQNMANQDLQQNIANEAFAQKQATKAPSFWDALGQGFIQSGYDIGHAPGNFVNTVSGLGMGSGDKGTAQRKNW